MSSRATSVDLSVPTTFAVTVVPVESSTRTFEAPSTTCSLVRMWPSSSMITPDPPAVAVPPWPSGAPLPSAATVEVIDTRPARRSA